MIDELRCIVDDPGLKREVLGQSERLLEQEQHKLELLLRQLTQQLSRDRNEVERMDQDRLSGDSNDVRREELTKRIAKTESRIEQVNGELAVSNARRLQRQDIEEVLSDFDHLWKLLRPKERAQLLGLLIARVEFDRDESTLAVSYHPTAIKALVEAGAAAEGDVAR